MNSLLLYIIYGIVGGPAFGLAYGLKEYSPVFCFIVLSLTYILSIVVVHLVLSRVGLEQRFKNKIFSRVSALVRKRGKELALKMDDVAGRFSKELGDMGFYLALMSFTFMFGVYWAGLIAFIMQLDLLMSIASISIGAVISVGFWTYVIVKSNIDPQMVTLFFFLLTVVFIIYGCMKENKTLARMTEKINSELEKLI